MVKAFRQHSELPTARRYAIAVLVTVVVAIARYALRGVIGDAAPFLPFLAAVVVSAWAGGFWPGILAAVLSAVLGVVLFPGGHTVLELSHPSRPMVAGSFFLLAAVFSGVCETMHRSLARVEAHRKELLTEIANRKAAEELLASERRMLEEIARTTPGLVYLFDLIEERAIYVNPGISQTLGYTADEILAAGSGVGVLLQTSNSRAPAERTRPFQNLADGEVYDHVIRVRHASGEYRWLHSREVIFARDDAGNATRILGTAYDITQQHEAEAETARLIRRLTALTDNTPLALIEWDAELRITRWAGQAEKIFEWTSMEVVGKQLHELLAIPEESLDHSERLTARLRDPAHRYGMFRGHNRTRSGREITCEWYNSALHDEEGRLVAGLSLLLDVTEREQAVQALRDADRRKDEFIATLSHELRNPLAPIRSTVDVLRRKPELDEAVQRLCGVIGRQADHMTRLVDELLDLSRITRGKIELRREPVSLVQVVQAALEVAGPAIQAGGHTLTVELPPRTLMVEGDAVRLTQAVANLLNNAAKYTPHTGDIALFLETEGERAVIRVRDTGVGIPLGLHEEIFSMFAQVDRDLGRAQGGLGIGLSLVKSLVELHGGTVEVRSEGEGRGAEFSVRLPLLEGTGPDVPPREEPEPMRGGACRVMVVDDNRDAAESLAELLAVDGHEVRAAFSGKDALRQFRELRADLVLLDLGMPGMDGFQTLAELRKLPGGAEVCVSALTGWGQDEDRRRTAEAGFDHHLTKPVDLASLLELIARIRR